VADEPISSLTLYTTYHTDDEVEILDVHDTTFAATGTNKRVTLSSLVSLVGLAPLASPAFTGTVTLPTGLTGLLKAAAGVVSTATAGTDYLTPTGSGAGLSGVVLTTGSYSSPSWLTAISGGIVSGNISGNAASITGSITTSQISNLSSWAGSASITTLGTIGSGIWQGTAIAATYLPAMGASGGSHAAGLVPDPGSSAGTTHFLREDATWAVPAGGSGSPGGSSGQIQYNSSSSFAGAANWTIGSSGQLSSASQSAPGSPADGDQWNDSTQLCEAVGQHGLTVYRGGLIYSQTTSVTLATTGQTTLVNTSGAVGTVVLPANWWAVGQKLVVEAFGTFTTSSSQGTITIVLLLAGTTIGTTGGISWTASKTSYSWRVRARICCTAISSGTGTFWTVGEFTYQAANNPNTINGNQGCFNPATTGGLASKSIATNASQTFDLQANESVTGQSLTLYGLTLETVG